MRDGLQECGRAGAVEAIEVDASVASVLLARLKSEGENITWTHVFVRATAMALQSNPELHRLVAGNKRLHPATVDICLSLDSESSVTPVLIVEDAANKDLRVIANEIRLRAPDARQETQKMVEGLRKLGWLVTFSRLRRFLMRFLLRRSWYRRRVSGTFQVTCLPGVDMFAPFLFNTAGALGVGRVSDRVVARNGQSQVRPMVTLCCSLDHSQWNGMEAAKFLSALRDIVESGAFAEGLGAPAVLVDDQPSKL